MREGRRRKRILGAVGTACVALLWLVGPARGADPEASPSEIRALLRSAQARVEELREEEALARRAMEQARDSRRLVEILRRELGRGPGGEPEPVAPAIEEIEPLYRGNALSILCPEERRVLLKYAVDGSRSQFEGLDESQHEGPVWRVRRDELREDRDRIAGIESRLRHRSMTAGFDAERWKRHAALIRRLLEETRHHRQEGRP